MNRENAFTETSLRAPLSLRETPCHSEGKARRISGRPRHCERQRNNLAFTHTCHCERQRSNLAFTLVELLTVIAIMTILAGLLLPALTKAREKAKVAKCISTIASLQTALGMYQVDYGMYPLSSNNATQHNGNSHENNIFDGSPNNLVAALTAITLGGPYIEFKGGDLIDAGSSSSDNSWRYVLKDPWGQAYIYVSRKYEPGNNTSISHGPFHPHNDSPSDRNNNTYNIYSIGPDKETYGATASERIYTESDWDDPDLFDDTQGREGNWNGTTNKDDPQYDDINSWDGSRSF